MPAAACPVVPFSLKGAASFFVPPPAATTFSSVNAPPLATISARASFVCARLASGEHKISAKSKNGAVGFNDLLSVVFISFLLSNNRSKLLFGLAHAGARVCRADYRPERVDLRLLRLDSFLQLLIFRRLRFDLRLLLFDGVDEHGRDLRVFDAF